MSIAVRPLLLLALAAVLPADAAAVPEDQVRAWSLEIPPRLVLEEVLRLGSSDTAAVEDPEAFWDVKSVLIDAAHRLFVLDAQHGRIQVFDHNGAFVMTLGFGIGKSPGRFLTPVGAFWLEPDSSLGVVDAGNNTITVLRASGAFVTRIALPGDLRSPSSSLSLPDGQIVVSAFSPSDSTVLHILSRRLRIVRSGGHWQEGRPLLVLRRFGGMSLSWHPKMGVPAAYRNPGHIEGYATDLSKRWAVDLSDLAPLADSAVLRAGPDGKLLMSGATRVREITGIAALDEHTVVVSVFQPATFTSSLIVADLTTGQRRVLDLADPTDVIGCAFPGHLLLHQMVGSEYVVLYRIVEPPGACVLN